MNERIKQLAEQAEEYAYSVVVGGIECQEAYTKKFAELIIQECASIAYDYDAPKMSGPGMIIAGRIETHFGVEQ